jgi:DNA-binding CsgD family transcriptional regulator
MEHLIFFAYILLFSSGFAGVVSLAYLRSRVRRSSLGFFIAVQASYLFALACQAVFFYLENVVYPGGGMRRTPLGNSLLISSGVGGSALYWFSWFALRADGYFKSKRGAVAFLPPLVSVSVFLSACLMSASLVAYAFGVALRLPPVVSYFPATVSILSAGTHLVSLRFTDEPSAYRMLVRGYGVSLLAFVPLTVLEMYLGARVSLKPLSLDFVFFFMWNSVAIAAAFRSLRPLRPETAPALLDSVPGSLVERFGLSPRECEMILLIARGLPNKGIAAELGISPATVRTHIYNLFQKVGARSRIELFALLKAASE